MNPLIADYLQYVQQRHADLKFERDPVKVCDALGIHYSAGPRSACNFGPPAMIVVEYGEFGSRRLFTVAHELGHFFMHEGKFHKQIVREHASVYSIKRHVEKLADFAGSLLLMPEFDVRAARREYGERPEAILHLMKLSGASEAAAMRRWAWQDMEASRGVFVTQGNYISDLTACNMRLPVSRWQRVPEVTLRHPEVAALSLGAGRLMGVVSW